jgi:hypothetical protein
MKQIFHFVVSLCLFTGLTLSAQTAVPPPMPAWQPLAAAALDPLLGPIALYPDPLLAQILPAATFPVQIVLANRYVTGGGNPNQIEQQPWDASILALTRYPNVLKYMDDNLSWTTALGQAFLNQPSDVMNSIQRLRASASHFGNLQSTPQQEVIADAGNIEIVPVDPSVIYVPAYQPDQVYDDSAVGLPFITFGIGWPVGVWLNGDFDWRNRHLIDWDHDHGRPANWWHESPGQRDLGHASVWRPSDHPGNFQASRGDRGRVGTSPARSTTPGFSRSEPARPQPREPVATVHAAAPAPVFRSAPVSRPQANSAFIGIQSSHATQAYSQRGQQSIRAMPRSAPAAAPRASFAGASRGGGGGGGGSHAGKH